jgi:hypothetical protein
MTSFGVDMRAALSVRSGAINFPYGQGFRDELLLEESFNVKNILSKATPGALEQAFSEVKPTTLIGTCIIVYDNVGDNMDLTGPAADFAETAVRLGLVPEVGRIAGGFQAFQELQNCVFVEKYPDSSRTTMTCSDRPLSLRSRLSLANTPQTGEAPYNYGSALEYLFFSKEFYKKFTLNPLLLHCLCSAGDFQICPSSDTDSAQSLSQRRSTSRWKVTIDAPAETAPAEVLQSHTSQHLCYFTVAVLCRCCHILSAMPFCVPRNQVCGQTILQKLFTGMTFSRPQARNTRFSVGV